MKSDRLIRDFVEIDLYSIIYNFISTHLWTCICKSVNIATKKSPFWQVHTNVEIPIMFLNAEDRIVRDYFRERIDELNKSV